MAENKSQRHKPGLWYKIRNAGGVHFLTFAVAVFCKIFFVQILSCKLRVPFKPIAKPAVVRSLLLSVVQSFYNRLYNFVVNIAKLRFIINGQQVNFFIFCYYISNYSYSTAFSFSLALDGKPYFISIISHRSSCLWLVSQGGTKASKFLF